MRFILLFCVVVIVGMAGGCANHPLQHDVTDYDTTEIIHKARCEIVRALEDYYQYNDFNLAETELSANDAEIVSINKKLEDLSKEIDRMNDDISRLNPDIFANERDFSLTKAKFEFLVDELTKLDDSKSLRRKQITKQLGIFLQELKYRVALRKKLQALSDELGKQKSATERNVSIASKNKKLIETYRSDKANGLGHLVTFQDSNVAMQFRFKITETNNATNGGSFVWPIHNGAFTIGYNSGGTKERDAERIVSVADDFDKLRKIDCSKVDAPGSRRATVYPLTGNIGLEDTVLQYLTLSEKAGLTKGIKANGEKTFSDKLTFTTTFTGGIKPSFVLSPTAAHTIKYNGDFSATRVDLHEVIVDIAVKEKAASSSVKEQQVSVNKLPILNVRTPDSRLLEGVVFTDSKKKQGSIP